jgi:hypothetical protein
MAASFPEPVVVVDFDGVENKYAYANAKQIPVGTIEEAQKALLRLAKLRPGTAILDHLDGLVLAISESICTKLKVEAVSLTEHGRGWNLLSMRTARFIGNFFRAAEKSPRLKSSIVISHSRSDKERKSLVVTDSIGQFVCGKVNNIGYVYKEREGGELSWWCDLSGDSGTASGCRNPVLAEAGSIPNDYDAVVKLFRPTKAQMRKAWAYLERKKLDPDAVKAFIKEEYDVNGSVEMYSVLRELCDSRAARDNLRKMMKESE